MKPNNWLAKFLTTELVSAETKLRFSSEDQLNIEENINIQFDFATAVYRREHLISYSQNWDLLTQDGTENPPKIDRHYPHSTIVPWTNELGEGVYKEYYYKTLDNWKVFDGLNFLLKTLSKTKFDDAVNGLFYDDEVKWLKKQYKSKEMRTSMIWRQLNFDSKGNVIGLSSNYLEKNIKVEEAIGEVLLTNKNGMTLSFQPLKSKVKNLVSGVEIKLGENVLQIYNKTLNISLYKFCADLFPEPAETEKEFLLSIHNASKKGTDRFDSLATNE